MTLQEFRASKTGKVVETAMWQILNIIIAITISYAMEFNVAVLIAMIPALNWTTKFINTTYLK